MIRQDIFLLTGSNSGDRLKLLTLASQLIGEQIGKALALSSIYETAPWGKTDQPSFLNQAIKIETPFSPHELLSEILALEQKLGRVRTEKWGERSIDIDIIYFGDMIVDASDLIIPHPRLTERKFVLIPLAEIAPDFVHPILQKSNAQLLQECKDSLSVKLLKG